MAQAVDFEAPYLFKRSDVVVIMRHSLDKHLRHGQDKEEADGDGGTGKKARWVVTVREQNGVIEAQFKNQNTDRYLRIKNDKVDVDGGGGKWTWFRVHRQNIGIVKLESVHEEGKYVAVNKEGVKIGKGGPWCRFLVLREGQRPPYRIPYYFARVKTVVIEHRDLKHIRVVGQDSEEVSSEGGKGEFAQFEATPGDNGKTVQLKSKKNGKYLRIKQGETVDCGGHGGPATILKVIPCDHPNQVMLESNKFPGKYIMLAPAKQSLKVGDGKNKRCIFTFYRHD